MIDKVFEYVKHEYEYVLNTLENLEVSNHYETISKAFDRAFGAVSFVAFTNPELNQDIEQLWEVWRRKFSLLFIRN